MIEISDEAFEKIIADAMDSLPEHFLRHAKNVAIVWADEPTNEQRQKLKLRGNQSLFGLYEGIPLVQRGDNYQMVLPDKITIFKTPMVQFCNSIESLKKQVKHTLWHEIAHHYGLNHDRIHEIEDNWK